MLPLLTGAAAKMLGPAGSTTAKTKKISKEKLLGSEDIKSGKESVNITEKSIKLLPAAPKLSLPESTTESQDLSSKPTTKISVEALKSKGDYIGKVLDNIINYFKTKKKNTQKEIQYEKKNQEIEKKRKREEELEKKPTKGKGFSMPSVPGMSFLDRIINFFTSILLGSFLVFLLRNSNKIFKTLDDISKGVTNIWDLIRLGIISLSVTAGGLIKSVAKLGSSLLKGPARLTGNLIKNLGKSIKNVFNGVGKFVVNNIKRMAGLAAGAAPGTRGGGSKRVDPSKAKRTITPKKPVKPGTPRQTNPSVLNKAKNLFSNKGSKHLGKVSKVFKKIPFIGALIGIGIDMAMGERLDNAIAGAAGASLGAAIGGAIGTFALPIPGLGSFLGGMVGAAIGDWAGKEIYKKLSGQMNEIKPPESELLAPTDSGYSDTLQRRLDSPLPHDAPPVGSVPAGRLSITQLVSLAKSVGFPDNEAAIMASIAMGESGGNSNAHNDNPATGDDSYGLWQINMIGSLGPDRRKKLGLTSDDQLKDPVTNARAARLVRNESGLSAWTVYKKGIYKKYLPDAQKALKNAPVIPRDPAPDLSKAPPAPILPSREQLDANGGRVPGGTAPVQISQQQITRSSEGLAQQASYEQQSSPVIVMGGSAPQLSGGGSPGTGGMIPIPVGMSKKEALNSYYQSQLMGFLFKQG